MAPRSVTVHVLYGIPCVGKSTTAVAFAYHQNIRTVIHTDYLREVQRHYVSPTQLPVLAKVTHSAWELHGQYTRDSVLAGFADHVAAVAPAIRTVVAKLVDDGFDAVIEGAHFDAGLIRDLQAANKDTDIQPTLLTVTAADEIRQRILRKGQERAGGVGRAEWTENLATMLTIQEHLISDAHTHGIRVTTAETWRTMWLPPTAAKCST